LRLAFVAGLLGACSIGQPGKERLGDDAWHEGRWGDAVAAYRAAGQSPRIEAKLADAALQGGMLFVSAQAWTALGTGDTSRAGEAASGLARVAEAAQHDGNDAALQAAVLGLRRIAPGWPPGRLALGVGTLAAMPPADAAELIPAVLAASSGRVSHDPLLVDLGVADRARGACSEAVPILEGVLRQSESASSKDSATTTLEWCDLGLGLQAMNAARPGDAERWFDHAARLDPQGLVGRRALVGFGDARASQGDSTGARVSWQQAAVHEPPDTIAQMALARLVQVTPHLAGDTTPVARP
jgi:hypothetical protein